MTKKPAPAPTAARSRKPPEPEPKKPAAAAARTKSNVPAIAQTAGLPATLRDRAVKDAGRGLSSAADDNLIPLIYCLTVNSPQASAKNPAYIEGARPGDLWLRGAQVPIIAAADEADSGAEFQPAYFGKEWLEWLPNRGGFAGRHPWNEGIPPSGARRIPNPERKGRLKWVLGENDLVESRFFAGHVRPLGDEEAHWLPYIIPFKGTGHTVARQWMNDANNLFLAGGSRPDPLWLHRYQILTQWKQNDAGEWYIPLVNYLGPIASEEHYERGERMNSAFSSGALQAAVDEDLAQQADHPAAAGTDPEEI